MVAVRRVLPWRRRPERTVEETSTLLTAFRERHRARDASLIERAYQVALSAHEGQTRKSGEPYIHHPMSVATIVARQGLDDVTIAAALLHDAVEDTSIELADLERDFGPDVAMIVDGVTKLDRLSFDSKEDQQAASMRKMLVALAKDLRVLIIKLADRLHNMRTLAALPDHKQQRTARETLDIYAPLAHRLGMEEVKVQLEDLALATLHPKRYSQIDQMVQDRSPERDLYLTQMIGEVEGQLKDLGVKAEVTGRPKHLWSIYEKMIVKGRSFEEIHDLVGVRVIVENVRDCYAALGSIHAVWKPVQGRFKDYVAMPKFNLYQSLHTTVIGPQGKQVEFQIRTFDMHHRAEHGVAAHWDYKGAAPSDEMAWLNRIVEWQEETTDPGAFMANLKTDLEQDEVYVFTPQGRVITLPIGATPVDFAYTVHTEIGHSCVGARVGGRLVPLDTRLESGETVEIVTSKQGDAGPSRDWLQFVASHRAANKIRHWYSKERRAEAIDQGHEALVAELRRAGLPIKETLDGDLLVLVTSPPPGVALTNHGCLPLAHRPVSGAEVVAEGTDAVAAHARAVDEWRTLTAASLVGMARTALDLGVDYAKERHQFGKPIGSFQAVQHLLADLPGLIDGARLLAAKAAWAGDRDAPGAVAVGDNDITDFAALAAMAFTFAGEAAATATDRSLHVHGGYGFSEEYDIQLFFRRARAASLVLDDPARECRRLADLLFTAAESA